PASTQERPIRRDREEIVIVVDEGQAAERPDPVGVADHEVLELLAGPDEEVGPLEGRLAGHVGEERVPVGVHGRASYGWNSRSGPIRSRRIIECWRSKIHSEPRWARARMFSSSMSLSNVA